MNKNMQSSLRQQSIIHPHDEDTPTIGAKPIRREVVIGPIRRRFRGLQAIWYILGIIETLLFLRFFLKFIGANESAGFTRFIYNLSYPFAGPFVNVVDPSVSGESVFEWSMLLGMVVFALIAWGIVRFIVMSKPVSDSQADERLEQQE